MNMKQMNQNDWLDWYVKHGGQSDLHLRDDETVLFHEEHGFFSFFVHDDILDIHHMAGDGAYWVNIIKQILNMAGLHRVRWFTQRNPYAFIRKFGGHIKGYYMECELDESKI